MNTREFYRLVIIFLLVITLISCENNSSSSKDKRDVGPIEISDSIFWDFKPGDSVFLPPKDSSFIFVRKKPYYNSEPLARIESKISAIILDTIRGSNWVKVGVKFTQGYVSLRDDPIIADINVKDFRKLSDNYKRGILKEISRNSYHLMLPDKRSDSIVSVDTFNTIPITAIHDFRTGQLFVVLENEIRSYSVIGKSVSGLVQLPEFTELGKVSISSDGMIVLSYAVERTDLKVNSFESNVYKEFMSDSVNSNIIEATVYITAELTNNNNWNVIKTSVKRGDFSYMYLSEHTQNHHMDTTRYEYIDLSELPLIQ
jgi:hypothetical protein